MAQAYPEIRTSGAGAAFPETTVDMDTGDSSAEYQVEVWNDRGALQVDTVTMSNVRVRLVAQDGAAYVSDDLPPVDQQWGRAKVTGMDNGGDAEMAALETGWHPVGYGSEILLGDIPPDCARFITLQIVVPIGGGDFDGRIKFELVWDSTSLPLASKSTLWSGAGVLPAVWNASARKLVSGGELTGDGTDAIYVAARIWAADGEFLTALAYDTTINQNDSAAAALAVGESYLALISQPIGGGNPVVTKGVKGVAPVEPSLPADSIRLGVVTILYDAGGTTITAAEIDTASVLKGEYHAEAGTGLALIIHGGDAVSTTDLYQFATARTSVTMTNTATNSVWLHPDGSFSANTTAAAPVIGAQLLWTVVAAGGVITTITDARSMLSRPILIHAMPMGYREVFGALALPAEAVDAAILPFDAELVEVVHDLLALDPDWTAGALVPDIRYFTPGAAIPFPAGGAGTGGATIYANDGSDEYKPSIDYNAATLRTVAKFHEVRRFAAGTRFVLDYLDAPTPGVTEDEVESIVTLMFRRY